MSGQPDPPALDDAECDRLRALMDEQPEPLDPHFPAIRDALSVAVAEASYEVLAEPYRAALTVLERAVTAGATLAEVRQTVTTFLTHYGNSSSASFKVAQDLAHAVAQVLDRAPLAITGDGREGSGEETDHG